MLDLIFITRKIDDSDHAASFVSEWIRQFAQNLPPNKLIVICQETGQIPFLGKNVVLHSLGKERGNKRLKQFFLFQKYLLTHLKTSRGVFAHMIQHYSILAGPWCLLFKKPLFQWYMHKNVNLWLRIAAIFVTGFITASSESFRLKTKRPIYIFGHGINTNMFIPPQNRKDKKAYPYPSLLTIGRISPVKNLHIIIKAVEILVRENYFTQINLKIVGGPGLSEQESYFAELKQYARDHNLERVISFLGPLPHFATIPLYQNTDLFINFSETGSLDKVVLEALACGAPVLTSNEAFNKFLPKQFFEASNEPQKIAARIKTICRMNAAEKQSLLNETREKVLAGHNIQNLAKKIVALYK